MARPATPRETNPDAMFDAPNLRVYIHKAATAHLLNALGKLCERPEGLTEEIKELCGLLDRRTAIDEIYAPDSHSRNAMALPDQSAERLALHRKLDWQIIALLRSLPEDVRMDNIQKIINKYGKRTQTAIF